MKRYFLLALLLSSISLSAQKENKEITLEDIWTKGTFSTRYIYGLRSMNDGMHYTRLKEGIVKYHYGSGDSISTIVAAKDLIPEGKEEKITIEDYQFSADEKKILIATDAEQIYRHSTRESYYVWDLEKKKLFLLTEGEKQMLGTFSPNGDQVAFVRDNNLFVKDLSVKNETQITSDGFKNSIINGASDWVYEEEFGFDKAFFWSPDGKKIAFYRFDESQVKEFNMPTYGKLYPDDYRFKYPKAGEQNAFVTLHIYDLATQKTVKVDVGDEKDQYIPRVKWTKDSNTLSFIRMNRHQNHLELLFADASSGKTKLILEEKNDTYIDIDDDLTFLSDQKHFIWTSEKDGFKHVYLYDITGILIRQVTKGKWDVMSFEGIDENSQRIFFIAAKSDPSNREVISIKTDGSGEQILSPKTGTNNASFSKGFKYYINTWSDANSPYHITLHDIEGREIRVLEDNARLKEKLKSYELPEKTFFSFTTSEGLSLNGWMIKPKNFDKKKKYPVFMTVYGGPGANTVNNSWGGANYIWHQMLAQKGYIVVSVDNRGTGARGADFKKITYKQLGKYETIDQIEAAKYLGSLPYVDKTRIGIQGWSYGGYMSSLCMTKGHEYFRAGIAVAPVTNWRYYDSIYTERYMQTPEENEEGYDKNSPINFVDSLKGKYLLAHGTADDNVHFQNTIEMISALNKAGKQYDLVIYPDNNHGIYHGNSRMHLYNRMTDFLLENL